MKPQPFKNRNVSILHTIVTSQRTICNHVKDQKCECHIVKQDMIIKHWCKIRVWITCKLIALNLVVHTLTIRFVVKFEARNLLNKDQANFSILNGGGVANFPPPPQRTTAVIMGCFAGCMCKNYKKWYTPLPKLLYKFYSTNAIYKCGGGLHTTTWHVTYAPHPMSRTCGGGGGILVTAVHNI
jgi:hypothetical protein